MATTVQPIKPTQNDLASISVMREMIGSMTADLISERTDKLVLKINLDNSVKTITEQEELIKKLNAAVETSNNELKKKVSQLTNNVIKNERMLTIMRTTGSLMPDFCKSGAKALDSDWLNPWDISPLSAKMVRDYLTAARYADAATALGKILNILRIQREGQFKQFLSPDYNDASGYKQREYVLFQVLVVYIKSCDSSAQEETQEEK